MRTRFVRWPRGCANYGVALLTIAATSIGSSVFVEGAIAQPGQQSSPAAKASHYAAFVAEAARRFGVPAAWIRAVIAVESRGDPHAVSPAGAVGLMQLMPHTWQFERAQLGLGSNPFDARDNILAGSDYLRAMHARYGPIGMLAAYNAGPHRYDDYRRGDRPLPAETLAYVRRLAPVVTGDAPVVAATNEPSDPLAWTRAPLFVTQPVAAPTIASVAGIEAHSATPESNGRSISSAAQSHIIANPTAAHRSIDSVFVALDGAQS